MHTVLSVIFWLSLLGILYTYLGYPLLITLIARWRSKPVRSADITPSVTMLVAAYNEQDCIANKIENTLALDYPLDRLDLLVVTDGSTDRTNEIVASYAGRGVRLLYEPQRGGKVGALLRGFPQARGEIVVFSDANAFFQRDTLRKLVRHFADPEVGGASGVKRMLREGESAAGQGEGLYWRYESYLKACDSAVSSVMGVPGEIWAVRREAYIPPEPNTILDDFVASLRLVQAGWRVVFDPQAVATEEASPSLRAEWARRARNAAGGWQAFFQLPGHAAPPAQAHHLAIPLPSHAALDGHPRIVRPAPVGQCRVCWSLPFYRLSPGSCSFSSTWQRAWAGFCQPRASGCAYWSCPFTFACSTRRRWQEDGVSCGASSPLSGAR